MIRQFADRAVTTLASGISTGDTSLTLASASGFPSAPFDLRIGQELMLVRARSGVNCTLVDRAQGGTVAQVHAHGTEVRHVITAAALRNLLPKLVIKPGDTTRSLTIVLANDPDLTLAIAANEIWKLEFVLFVRASGTTTGLRIGLSVPSGATVYGGIHALQVGALGAPPLASNDLRASAAAGTTISVGSLTTTTEPYLFYVFKAMVANGANAGAVTFQWAQGSSSSQTLTIMANSFIVAHELAA